VTLADEVRRTRSQPGPACAVSRLNLDAADRADLDELLADVDVQSTAIGEALRARGHRVSDFSVRWHRRGSCACDLR
jgi:hypothetical protein